MTQEELCQMILASVKAGDYERLSAEEAGHAHDLTAQLTEEVLESGDSWTDEEVTDLVLAAIDMLPMDQRLLVARAMVEEHLDAAVGVTGDALDVPFVFRRAFEEMDGD